MFTLTCYDTSRDNSVTQVPVERVISRVKTIIKEFTEENDLHINKLLLTPLAIEIIKAGSMRVRMEYEGRKFLLIEDIDIVTTKDLATFRACSLDDTLRCLKLPRIRIIRKRWKLKSSKSSRFQKPICIHGCRSCLNKSRRLADKAHW